MASTFSGTGSFSEAIAEHDDITAEIKALIELPAEFDHDELLDEVDRQFVETLYLLVT
jgi:hypothetical protein